MSNVHGFGDTQRSGGGGNGGGTTTQMSAPRGDAEVRTVNQNPTPGGMMTSCCSRVPLVTTITCAVEFILWIVLIWLTSIGWDSVACMMPAKIADNGEVWRMLTSTLTHTGYWSIWLDLVFFFMVGMHVELMVGSLRFAYFMLLLTIFSQFFNFLLSSIPYWAGYDPWAMRCQCDMFILIMALIVAEIRLFASKWTSCCMIFPVPSWLYPIVLAGFILLISFSISPLMELIGGVLGGFMFWTGVYRWLVCPQKCWEKTEKKICPKIILKTSHFVTSSEAQEDLRHFSKKMGQGPEPWSCFCNRFPRNFDPERINSDGSLRGSADEEERIGYTRYDPPSAPGNVDGRYVGSPAADERRPISRPESDHRKSSSPSKKKKSEKKASDPFKGKGRRLD